jgi:hypothetical protein
MQQQGHVQVLGRPGGGGGGGDFHSTFASGINLLGQTRTSLNRPRLNKFKLLPLSFRQNSYLNKQNN